MRKIEERKARAEKMSEVLDMLFPEKKGTELFYSSSWELLVAVILSAQNTDKGVNKVTPMLFERYKTLDDYVKADEEEFRKYIRSINFYRNKARNILSSARRIKEDFGGEVPQVMEELMTLPGVARKTANVVLSNAFGIVSGIAVDTHVKRFVQKFDLSDSSDPRKIEQDLMQLLSKERWFNFGNDLIYYGRQYCPARKHDCSNHPLTRLYPEAAFRWPQAK